MDPSLVIVLIWLVLPIVAFLLKSFYQQRKIKKYPSLTTGRVSNISTREAVYVYDYGYVYAVTVYYIYKVAGRTYAGGNSPLGKNYKIGDDIAVRYITDRPEKSIIWEPAKTKNWIIIGAFLLAFDLGYSILLIFFGIFLVTRVVHMAKHSFPKSEIFAISTAVAVLVGLTCMGLLSITLGIHSLLQQGFLKQNLIWLALYG